MDRHHHTRPARAQRRRRAERRQLVGSYQSVGSRLTVSTDGDGLEIDLAPVEAPAETPSMRGQLLPVSNERFVLRAPASATTYPSRSWNPTATEPFSTSTWVPDSTAGCRTSDNRESTGV